MVFGTLFSHPAPAAGAGVTIALAIAALGGAMLPIEFFGDTLRIVAHATPHAWALDAFAQVLRRDGGIGDILPELGVLALFAIALLALASWRMRVAITRG
jgi:ABC-2 type transport system permease protein